MSEYGDHDDKQLRARPVARRRVVPVQYEVLPSTGQDLSGNVGPEIPGQKIWRHKWIVAGATVTGLLAGCVATRFQVPIYRASATLEIQRINENFLSSRELSPMAPPSQDTDIQTQAKLLQSRRLVEQVSGKLTAARTGAVADASAGNGQAAGFRVPDVDFAARTLRITVPERTRMLEVTCDSPDARVAAAFVNSLVTEFAESTSESQHSYSVQTTKWLNEQVHDLKNMLGNSEQELQAYAGKSDLVYLPNNGTIAEEKLQRVQDELSRTQAELVARRSRYELATHSPAETLPEILDSGSLRNLQTRITELKRELAELRSSFTPAYYKVERVQAQLATLEPMIDRERDNILGRIRNDYLDAQHREKALLDAYRQQAHLVSEQAVRAVHYDILKRQVESERQLYATMLTRVKEAGMAAALSAGTIRVVDTSDIPKEPRSPNPVQNAGMGSVCGLAAGGLLAMLKGRVNRYVCEPGEAGELLNVNELGTIPSVHPFPKLVEERKEKASSSAIPSLRMPTPKTTHGGCSEIWTQHFSLMTESFRGIVLSILYSESSCRIIAIASPMPMDGKTTVAANLAIGMASKGERVLLIDGDLRKPKLHGIFGLENRKGLADLLCSATPAADKPLSEFYSETFTPGLFLMAHGNGAARADALHGIRMAQIMTNLRCDFDRIVIDTPPMLHLADARILGRAADGVVLVIRANSTDRGAAQTAAERFFRDGTPVLGCVLNDWNPRKSTLSYYDPQVIQRYYTRGTRS